MQEQLSEVLDNILGLLLLEGSYQVEEDDENLNVLVETKDAGRLIGFRGESLEALQLITNQIMARKTAEGQSFKRVVLDVEGWRKQKEQDLLQKAKDWSKEVLESGKEIELEPMSSWQRRVIHMGVQEVEGVESESIGEGRDRRIVIKPSKTS